MRILRRSLAILAIAAALAAGDRARASDDAATAAAEAPAKSWLALVDSGKYAESWRDAASLFRKQVTEAQWNAAVGAARGPLGALVARKLSHAEFRTSLPGAPDGAYVVLVYTSSFEKKKDATETVTPMKDTDGAWRVSGYWVR